MQPRWIGPLLVLGGLANIIGILVATRVLTDPLLGEVYPQVLSRTGQIGILLWGCAYIAVARNVVHVPWLLAVFALEKLFYVGTWAAWVMFAQTDLASLFVEDFIVGLFMAGYGANDLFFAVVFGLGFMVCRGYAAEAAEAAANRIP